MTIGSEDAWALFAVLFPDGSEGFVEVRAIWDGRVGLREFIPVENRNGAYRVSSRAAEVADVYVGVAPRVREEGTKDAVEAVHAVWVDLDFAGGAVELALFEIPPTHVVSSGTEGHLHAYWGLGDPAAPEEVEHINRALAQRLNGDRAAVDASRVMRMPGTYNFKHDPPVKARLVHTTDRRYSLAELQAVIPAEAEDEPGTSGAPPRATPSAPVRRLLDRLSGVRRSGSQWTALCPAHDDRRPSLSIGEGEDGQCLVHCHAKCTTEAVVEELGLRMTDLFPEAKGQRRASSRLVALAEQTGIELFHTPEGVAHAAIIVDGHRETWPVTAREFALWLRRLHYEAHQEALAQEVVAEAIATFEARAHFARG